MQIRILPRRLAWLHTLWLLVLVSTLLIQLHSAAAAGSSASNNNADLESYINPQSRFVSPTLEKLQSDKKKVKGEGPGVIIVATVDGNLAGIDKTTGKFLWKRQAPANIEVKEQWKTPHTMPTSEREADSLTASVFAPLLSTTTTTTSSSDTSTASAWRTMAVPFTDGRVYLTAHDVTVTTSVADLAARAPFVDARGRMYTSSRQATAFAIDGNTGQVMECVAADDPAVTLTSRLLFDEETMQTLKRQEQHDSAIIDANILWLGRVDESVSLYEPRSGELDVQFSTSRIMSLQDMLLGSSMATDTSLSSVKERIRNHHATQPSMNVLVATPNGNFALASAALGKVLWMAGESLETPVAYAIDTDTGGSIPVRLVQDAVDSNGSNDYLTGEIERQMRLLIGNGLDGSDLHDAEYDEQTIVGSLGNGQLYAIPLSNKHGIGSNSRYGSHTASSMSAHASKSVHVTSGVGGHQQRIQASNIQRNGPSATERKSCRPGSPDFPNCMTGMDGFSPVDNDWDNGAFLADVSTDGGMVPFYQNFDYEALPDHYFTMPHYDEQRYRERRRYRRLLRFMGSWLPPLIAMVFVVSFEMGRRKRQRETNSLDHQGVAVDGAATNEGVIQVFDDILGYGGHGTVVYKGSLEGRLVAVKRMLRAYHASADREISLLIESDGHPNVVRYFLKEVRGDFVYLALELCDLSLHDLISVILSHREQPFASEHLTSKDIIDATRVILRQIANGVMHLHSLRIVHRDLKPMNILLASSKKLKEDHPDVMELFTTNQYIAKISDMGLGKQLIDQSSYGASLIGESSIRGQSKGAQSSVAGVGPGSVGWQAPEVMARRVPAETTNSSRSSTSSPLQTDSNHGSASSTSPVDATSTRTSRSTDIFSLGCIFYSTLIPGSHPFGEWYEREANIMHNRPAIDSLKDLSPDAHDLVRAMINRDPTYRPTAKQVSEHPFFWFPDRRLNFLCEFSDRIESDTAMSDEKSTSPLLLLSLAVERKASEIVGLAWDSDLDESLISNVQKFRTYDPSSVRDLLRLIRNKHHHFDELPDAMKETMNWNSAGLLDYFEQRFPALLVHCYSICRDVLQTDDCICERYDITPARRSVLHRIDKQISTITEVSTATESQQVETPSLDESVDLERPSASDTITMSPESPQLCDENSEKGQDQTVNYGINATALFPILEQCAVQASVAGDIVIWESSTAAKTFHCRGWSRSDEEWERRVVDSALRKRDTKDLIRCSEDPRFRTRLCNYWSDSLGTVCQMRQKKKCIFAHGPVELRVKEGKRQRWGKLVDSNGDNCNKGHSGGEDTYGIAKSIEVERGTQRKPSSSKNGKSVPKKQPNSAKKKVGKQSLE